MKQVFPIKFYRIAALSCIMGWAWLALQLTATAHSANLTVCWVKRLTGIPCPGCGISRSIIAILNGRWTDVMQLNILGIPALLALLLVPVWIAADISTSRASLYKIYTAFENRMKNRPVLLTIILLPIIINWIWDVYKSV